MRLSKLGRTSSRVVSFVLATAFIVLALSGCGYRAFSADEEDVRTVGSVAGYDVPYDELFCLTMTYREALKKTYGSDAFDTPEGRALHREELEELVYGAVVEKYAILVLSEEIGYGADDVDAMVDEDMKELVSSLGGMHEYKKMLHEHYMTDRYARFATAVRILENNLLYSYINNLGLIESDVEKVYDAVMKDSVCARTHHIAVFKENGRTDAENREKIAEVQAKLDAGKDFDVLMEQYGEDKDQTENGYYFMRGEMQEAYENAAFSLSVGDVSDVVETESGYFLIRREEKETEYVMMNCFGEGSPLYDAYQYYTFLGLVEDTRETLTFQPNSYCSSLDLTELRQGVFFDLEYTLLVLLWVIVGLAVAALILWWVVASVRVDRKKTKRVKKRG